MNSLKIVLFAGFVMVLCLMGVFSLIEYRSISQSAETVLLTGILVAFVAFMTIMSWLAFGMPRLGVSDQFAENEEYTPPGWYQPGPTSPGYAAWYRKEYAKQKPDKELVETEPMYDAYLD